MADPFTLLAQQANQTANLFNAINDNTQKVFANRFAVQQAKTNLALNVAQQTEAYRMNDAKLKELEQTMRMREQEQAWRVKDQEFQDKVRPLQFKTQELMYENQFLQRTEQQLKPFMSDLNPILADLAFNNPDMATEADTRYKQIIYDITQKALKDPTIDIQKELEIKKNEIKTWAAGAKLTNKSGFDMPKLVTDGDPNNLLGSTDMTPSWLKKIESVEKNKKADPEVVARAAGIYKQFGGSDAEFLKKHDEDYARDINSNVDLMITTGRITSQEAFNNASQDQQKQILSKIKKNEQEQNLLATIKTYQTQLDDAMSADKGTGIYADRISSYQDRIKGLNDKYAKEFLGIDFDAKPNTEDPIKGAAESIRDTIKNEPVSDGGKVGDIINDDQKSRIKAVDKVDKSWWMLEWLNPNAGKINDLKNKVSKNKDELNYKNISELIGDPSEQRILELANNSEFNRFLTSQNLMYPASTQGDEFGGGYVAPSENKLLDSINILKNDDSEQASKKQAIKYLKSELPSLILRYANQ